MAKKDAVKGGVELGKDILSKVKKRKEEQQDLFPETIPKTPEQIKKLSKEEWKKLQENQMDMFPEDLSKRTKDAQRYAWQKENKK